MIGYVGFMLLISDVLINSSGFFDDVHRRLKMDTTKSNQKCGSVVFSLQNHSILLFSHQLPGSINSDEVHRMAMLIASP